MLVPDKNAIRKIQKWFIKRFLNQYLLDAYQEKIIHSYEAWLKTKSDRSRQQV